MVRKLALALVALTALGCAHTKNQLKEKERFRAREAAVVKIGDAAVKRLVGELKVNLVSSLKEGGFAGAIEFCSTRASQITAKVNAELSPVKIERLSDKFRNPENRATGEDLALILELKRDRELPKYVIKEKNDAYVYYKPIKVAPFCLNCHGKPSKMKPEVKKVLAERYPNDRATGYKAGELRGVFKVVIPKEVLGEES